MSPDEETVKNIRTFLKLHYETRKKMVELAEINFERIRVGLTELRFDSTEELSKFLGN